MTQHEMVYTETREQTVQRTEENARMAQRRAAFQRYAAQRNEPRPFAEALAGVVISTAQHFGLSLDETATLLASMYPTITRRR